MHWPLLGKVSIVSGGFTSVGASIAQRFAADGSNVILLHEPSLRSCAELLAHSINAQKAGIAVLVEIDRSAVQSSAAGSGSGCAPVPARRERDEDSDIMEQDRDDAVIGGGSGGMDKLDEVLRTFGRIDIVVHAEDVIRKGSLTQIDEKLYDEMVKVHVKEPLFLTKFVVHYMKQGGRVIFLSSFLTQATTVLPTALLYAGCKGAIEQATRVLAKDLGQRGITVNAVSLGPVDTPVFRAGKSPQDLQKIATLSPGQLAAAERVYLVVRMLIASIRPGKRLGSLDEIIPIIAFLATSEAGWVNGQVIGVNGGYIV